jgi:RNA polymerase sigma-70 factor (ECF subfamily)
VDDYEAFFARNYGPVLRAVTLAVGDPVGAEDAVQEAFARAYRRWRSVAAMERPVAWVHVVAVNVARKDWQRAERRSFRPAEASVVVDDVDPGTLDLRDALAQLTARQRAAVVLRYLADLSTRDVARALGCAEGTVKATLHQALHKLRVELDDDPASLGGAPGTSTTSGTRSTRRPARRPFLPPSTGSACAAAPGGAAPGARRG